MALTTKPDMSFAWASSGAMSTPPNSKIQTGWIQEKPPLQFENWLQNRQDVFLQHINQAGIPVWDSATVYTAGRSYCQGSDGNIYKALLDSSAQDPVGNTTYWTLWSGSGGGSTGTSTVDLTGYFLGAMVANQALVKFVTPHAVTLPASLSGSYAYCDTAPTSAVSLTIRRTTSAGSNTSIGTVNFAAGYTTATFVFPSSVTTSAGDRISILAPSTLDATFAGPCFGIAATAA